MKIDLILVQKTFVLIAIAFASAFSLEQLGVRLMSEKTRLDSSTVLFHWTLFNSRILRLKRLELFILRESILYRVLLWIRMKRLTQEK